MSNNTIRSESPRLKPFGFLLKVIPTAAGRPAVMPADRRAQCASALDRKLVAENDFGGANRKYRSYRLMII